MSHLSFAFVHLLFFVINLQALNEYESDSISYWSSTSSFEPSRNATYGTIQLRTALYMEFDIMYHGKGISEFENIFRIGHTGHSTQFGCDHSDRFPSMWIDQDDHEFVFQLTYWSGCYHNFGTFSNLQINHTYSIKIDYNQTWIYLSINNQIITNEPSRNITPPYKLGDLLHVHIGTSQVESAQVTLSNIFILSYNESSIPSRTTTSQTTKQSTSPSSYIEDYISSISSQIPLNNEGENEGANEGENVSDSNGGLDFEMMFYVMTAFTVFVGILCLCLCGAFVLKKRYNEKRISRRHSKQQKMSSVPSSSERMNSNNIADDCSLFSFSLYGFNTPNNSKTTDNNNKKEKVHNNNNNKKRKSNSYVYRQQQIMDNGGLSSPNSEIQSIQYTHTTDTCSTMTAIEPIEDGYDDVIGISRLNVNDAMAYDDNNDDNDNASSACSTVISPLSNSNQSSDTLQAKRNSTTYYHTKGPSHRLVISRAGLHLSPLDALPQKKGKGKGKKKFQSKFVYDNDDNSDNVDDILSPVSTSRSGGLGGCTTSMISGSSSQDIVIDKDDDCGCPSDTTEHCKVPVHIDRALNKQLNHYVIEENASLSFENEFYESELGVGGDDDDDDGDDTTQTTTSACNTVCHVKSIKSQEMDDFGGKRDDDDSDEDFDDEVDSDDDSDDDYDDYASTIGDGASKLSIPFYLTAKSAKSMKSMKSRK